MKEGCLRYLGLFLIVLVASLLFSLIFAYFAMLLWNYAVTAMFGLGEITFWQMFAFMILVRFIIMPTNITYKND